MSKRTTASIGLLLAMGTFVALQGPKAPGFSWTVSNSPPPQFDYTVEQQSENGFFCNKDTEHCVVNPSLLTATPCAWDPDDHYQVDGAGDLGPGESTEYHGCLYGDTQAHLLILSVNAGSNFAFQADIEMWQDGFKKWGVTNVGTTTNKNPFLRSCMHGPNYSGQSLVNLPFIPDSGINGPDGQAAPTEIVWRITNLDTKRTLRNVHASAYLSFGWWSVPQDTFCPHGYDIQYNGVQVSIEPRVFIDK